MLKPEQEEGAGIIEGGGKYRPGKEVKKPRLNSKRDERSPFGKHLKVNLFASAYI